MTKAHAENPKLSRYNPQRGRVKLIFLFGLLLLVVGLPFAFIIGSLFIKEYTSSLLNGYCLFKADRQGMVVCGADGTVIVGVTVVEIGVAAPYIVGRVAMPSDAIYRESAEVPGYFVLDTTNGSFERGLSEKECRNRVKNGGAMWPDLMHPDRWRLAHPFR